MAHLPHLLASCTRHRLTEAVAALWSGWRQLEEFLYRNHAQNLPEKVYLSQRIFNQREQPVNPSWTRCGSRYEAAWIRTGIPAFCKIGVLASFLGVESRAVMLPSLDRFVDGRSLADTGLGVPSPPSPPHPPCLPDWDTTPGMPCLGPAPPSFELIAEDESTTILAFAVMGLVAVIGLIAFARERSRELLQGNKAPRL